MRITSGRAARSGPLDETPREKKRILLGRDDVDRDVTAPPELPRAVDFFQIRRSRRFFLSKSQASASRKARASRANRKATKVYDNRSVT
jgi:hypothetical protein